MRGRKKGDGDDRLHHSLFGKAFLIIILRLGWQTVSALRRIDDEGLQGMVLATGAALIAALIAGIFDHYFFNLRFPHTVALFWPLVGLTVAGVELGLKGGAEARRDQARRELDGRRDQRSHP